MKKNICIGVLAVLLVASLALNGYSLIVNHNSKVTINKLKQTINQTKDTGTFSASTKDEFIANLNLNRENDDYAYWKLDEKQAFQIGNAILKSICGEDEFKKTNYKVYDVKDKGVYVVMRVPKDSRAGGDYGVAINKKDGKIIKIWLGA